MNSQPTTTRSHAERPALDQPPGGDHPHEGRHGHGWVMWLLCVPMLVLVGLQLAGGRAGVGGAAYALVCLVMMAAMMLHLGRGVRR